MTVSETNTARSHMTIRAVLLASMAFLALFGLQAAAAQAEQYKVWTDEGKALQASADTGLVGYVSTTTPIGTITCDVDSDIALSPYGTGKINGFFQDCSGTSYECEIDTTGGSVSEPWVLRAESDDVARVADADWIWTFHNCGNSGWNNSVWEVATTVALDPDNPKAISEYGISSKVLTISYGGNPYMQLGELVGETEVASEEYGRYGMGEVVFEATDPGAWTKDGDLLEGAQEVEFQGRASVFKATSPERDFECAVHGAAVFGPEAGTLTELEYDSGDCTGSGVMSSCKIASAELSTPTALMPYAGQMVAPGFEVTAHWLGAGCPLGGLTTATAVEAVFTPDDITGMSIAYLFGEGGSLMLGQYPIASNVEVSGELEVSPAFSFGLEPTEPMEL